MAQFFEHLANLAAEYEQLQVQNERLRTALFSHESSERTMADLVPDQAANSSKIHETSSQRCQHCDTLAAPLPQHTLATEPRFAAMPDPTGFQVSAVQSTRKSGLLRRSVASVFSTHKSAAKRTAGSTHSKASVVSKMADVENPFKVRARQLNLGDMKEKMRQTLLRESSVAVDVTSYYKTEGVLQYIARHRLFDTLTMVVIAINSLWMSIDADFNNGDTVYDTHPVFIVMDQIFCFYFVAELLIRFGAFEVKYDCLKDPWFIFDTLLVLLLVAESWIVNLVMLVAVTDASATGAGDATIFRLIRVVRLTRLLRMAKLLQKAPELLIMLKALAAAARTVGITLVLLASILYVAALGFRSALKGTQLGSTTFGSVPRSMHTLFVSGAIMEDTPELMEHLLKESPLAFVMMYMVIIMCGVTVMNMMIGILCEVVTAVAAAEHEAIHILFVKEMMVTCLEGVDSNEDGYIDQKEFLQILRTQPFVVALKQIGIDILGLVNLEEIIFEDAEEREDGIKRLTHMQFMEQLLLFRGSNTATVRDLMSLHKSIMVSFNRVLERITGNDLTSPVLAMDCADDESVHSRQKPGSDSSEDPPDLTQAEPDLINSLPSDDISC